MCIRDRGQSENIVGCSPILGPVRAGQVINPTRVMYFSAKNYSADFSETRGIDWTLLGASNEVRGTRGSGGNIPN